MLTMKLLDRHITEKIADRLVEVAEPAEGGLSWQLMDDIPWPFDAPNFAHGTAGVAYFLASVYQATGDNAYLEAAIQGAGHVQAMADDLGDNQRLVPHVLNDGRDNRYYLGFCHPGIEWDSLFQEFLPRQERLLSLGDEIEGLFKRERKSSERYVKKFFTILETPERRNDKIVEACHPWPPSPDDHMSPPELLSR